MSKKGASYTTAYAFRMALEERLKTISREQNIDIMRLRKQVAFDRLLARLTTGALPAIILKGGYGLELRVAKARSTTDIDLSIIDSRLSQQQTLEMLRERASFDSGDFFIYTIGDAILDITNAPYGGQRYPVSATMDGRLFVKFSIDAVNGDASWGSVEQITTSDWLSFAGFEPLRIPAISLEQQFAEKLHSYTRPRDIDNSRVKDLIDLYLLIGIEHLQTEKIADVVRNVFKRRATHDFPPEFHFPPVFWQKPFDALAGECEITLSMDRVFEAIKEYCLKSGLIR